MAWAVRWRRCVSVPPSLAVSKASEPLFSFSSSFFCSSKGLAAAERLGGRGGAEGGGGGCNWRLEPWYPSRCPHQPISIHCAVQSRRSIRKTRPLTSILILYGLCECEKVFHVTCASVQDYLLDLVLSLTWSQHQTFIFRLGMCCHQAIRPSCPSLVLTAVFVCDMQMSPFFFFLFWVEVSAGCRQRRLLTLTVKWASLCKSIGCSAGQRFIYRDALTPDMDDGNYKQMVLLWCTVFRPQSSSPAFVPERKFGYPSSKWWSFANLTANY